MQVRGMTTSDGEHIICTQCLAKFTAMGCTNAMWLAGKIDKTNGIVWAIQPPTWPLDQVLLSNISCSA